MSSEAVGWVYRHSPHTGAAFTVHLAIADSVSDQHGNRFWMAQANLAQKTRLSTRSVRNAIEQLADAGDIAPANPDCTSPSGRARIGRPVQWVFCYRETLPVVYETRRQTPADSAGVPRNQLPGTPATIADVTQEEPKQTRAARKHPIPDDWEPSDELLAWMRQHYPHIDPWPLAREFRSFHIARGTLMARWDWAFKNRVHQVDQRNHQTGPARTHL